MRRINFARFIPLPPRVRKARQRRFLAAYERTRGIKRAAALSGVHAQRHYDWLCADAGYRAAFARVRLQVAAAAERAVLRRAGGRPSTEAELMEIVRRLRRPAPRESQAGTAGGEKNAESHCA
jgi:hypothetical protein